MKSIVRLFCILSLLSCWQAFGATLSKLDDNVLNSAEFYLFDIKDGGANVARAIDAYVVDGSTYIAVTPILDSLRIKYILNNGQLLITFSDSETEVLLKIENEPLSDQTGLWFNDGIYTFIPLSLLEEVLETTATVSTQKLTLDFNGHTEDFPYKKIKLNNKQRSINEYLVGNNSSDANGTGKNAVITVPDKYSLFSVPTGTAVIDYRNNDTGNEYLTGSLQSVSDLAYHSTLITLTKTENELFSHTRLSRYPSHQGEKFFGIWDQYSFGDIFSRAASLSNEESRGLGISLSRNASRNYHENFTTSFEKVGRPGWEADIFHNDVFIRSIVIPNDGIIEFENVELYYGNNEFKIVMFGPYGEREELIEKIEARKTALAKGDKSFNLSLFEYESSLLDVNLDEFNIDAVTGAFQYGVLDSWLLGAQANISNLHDENQGVSYRIVNQVSLPDWYISNTVNLVESSWEQTSSIATSILPNDSLIFQYKSDSGANFDLNSTYNLRTGSITNYFNYNHLERDNSVIKLFTHRINFAGFGYNMSNSLTFKDDNGEEAQLGNLSLVSRLNANMRFKVDVPYNIKELNEFNQESISASFHYYVRTESTNQNLQLSGRSFGNENIWQLGYNLAWKQPTHFFTFGTTYSSTEQWNARAGISFNFGYDYYNNQLVFSQNSMRGAGTLDVHAYLDRRLNGIPDALDYNLEGVSFTGEKGWENVETNENGRALLFGARHGTTALSANWVSGADTLNQDYLIYNHPGSQQVINLPFYLSTEVEFFVLSSSEGGYRELSGVPIVAKNLATGDEYFVDSDMDGYVNFYNLMPGEYELYIEKDWLLEQGYNSGYRGFSFEAPLTGGFVLLPNIELTRQSGIAAHNAPLLEVQLNEDNYEQTVEDNDKLIHLPPKGGFKAPYLSDRLGEGEFRRIRQKVTQENRIMLRNRILNAQKHREFSNYGVDKGAINQIDGMSQPTNFLLSVGNFKTLLSLKRYIKAQGIVNDKIHRAMNEEGDVVYRFEVGTFESEIEAIAVGEANYSSLGYRVKTQVAEEYILQGWKVQFLAANSLENAKQLAEGIETVDELYVATKIVGEQSLYCVVSRTFFTKEEADLFLRQLNVDGFLVDTNNYLEVVWSK
ncbi:SPOR domain-containing protein [Psychrosphaera sp. F3M07]|uniref:SPOR domain-containing protein n=1 Tax=Psychrosphaera sp. F3M07 TaxID=2841560 RepID=UPI001C0A0442|nr:SPOR domain-containing protein [Psychrosphaera sp. F3M07]MBU2917118.1 SPOR domain-containing protein [Psychrosphaera sp. F3M07]